MRVLVTGANGFVGSELCRDLSRRGYGVCAAVRNSSRTATVGCNGVVIRSGNGGRGWFNALAKTDVVVHLAARVHVMNDDVSDPLLAFREANVRLTEELALAAAKQGVRRFVYVSSVKVNGETTRGMPFSSKDEARPQDAYGISKWEAEQSLKRIAADSDLELIVVRSPLVYGPGVGGNFLRLLHLVKRGMPLPVGAVQNRRSMIYNANLADALVSCVSESRAAGKTYLVSDGEDLSTPDLITQLAELMGARTRLWPVPPRLLNVVGKLIGKEDEVNKLVGSLVVDSSCLRDTLGWSAPFTVAHGLRETTRWFLGIS